MSELRRHLHSGGPASRVVLKTRPAAARAVTRFSGAAMIVIGIVLLGEKLIS